MVAEDINIARPGDGLGWSLRHRVFVGETFLFIAFRQAFQFVSIKAGQSQIVAAKSLQILQFDATAVHLSPPCASMAPPSGWQAGGTP